MTADDLAGMIAAVFAANSRGEVVGVQFFDPAGTPLTLGHAEAITDAPGLRVRSTPEPTADEIAARASRQPVLDPRNVQAPASMAELNETLKD